MRKKVTIVGAGMVGGVCAQRTVEKNLADVVLVDIVEELPQGKALDISQGRPVVSSDVSIIGTNSYDETANSDVVVITSGVARKPGQSRDDLVLTNMKIVKSVIKEVVKHSPNAIIILVANPLDAMTQLALHESKFPRERLFGQSGVLDSARFRFFLAEELKVSVDDVYACVLGGHGDTMVPVPRLSTVAGIPVTEILSKEAVDRIVRRTINGGAEVVALLKTSSAFYAPAVSSIQMVEAVLLDRKKILPCAVYLKGEYGIYGTVVGVPAKVGKNGIEEIYQLKLSDDELAALKKSAGSVKELATIMGI